jgi:hypothetical protein
MKVAKNVAFVGGKRVRIIGSIALLPLIIELISILLNNPAIVSSLGILLLAIDLVVLVGLCVSIKKISPMPMNPNN